MKEPKMEKGMKGTDRLSGLPEDIVLRIWYDILPKRVIHKPDHGKIEPDWKPVNWVPQGKIRG
jgi:hypothetical protein